MAYDPNRLYAILQNTGLQNKDNGLYQLLRELIGATANNLSSITEINNSITNITNVTNNITGNTASPVMLVTEEIVENIIYNVSGNSSSDIDSTWSVLTNGNTINPEVIFAGGDVVMVHTP